MKPPFELPEFIKVCTTVLLPLFDYFRTVAMFDSDYSFSVKKIAKKNRIIYYNLLQKALSIFSSLVITCPNFSFDRELE